MKNAPSERYSFEIGLRRNVSKFTHLDPDVSRKDVKISDCFDHTLLEDNLLKLPYS